MTKTTLRAATALAGIAGHSIFTHPFGHSRPVYDAPNDGGTGNPTPTPAPTPAPTPEPTPAPTPKPGPSDEEARLLKEVMEQKKAKKALEDQLKAFEGIDPAKVKELVDAQATAEAAAKAAEEEAALKRGEFDSVKKQMVDAHEAALKVERDAKAAAETALAAAKTTIENLTVGQSFTGSKYISENLVLTPSVTRTVLGSHFDVDAAGKVVGFDKPRGAADRAPIVDASGNPADFEAAVAKLVDLHPEKDRWLRSKQVPGTASSTTDDKTKPAPTKSGTGMSRIAANLAALKPQNPV